MRSCLLDVFFIINSLAPVSFQRVGQDETDGESNEVGHIQACFMAVCVSNNLLPQEDLNLSITSELI